MTPKKKRPNNSGKNVSPVLRVPASHDEKEAYAKAAGLSYQPFAAWARDALNARAKAQGFNPPEKLNDGKTDH
jgi:hypothetical protein